MTVFASHRIWIFWVCVAKCLPKDVLWMQSTCPQYCYAVLGRVPSQYPCVYTDQHNHTDLTVWRQNCTVHSGAPKLYWYQVNCYRSNFFTLKNQSGFFGYHHLKCKNWTVLFSIMFYYFEVLKLIRKTLLAIFRYFKILITTKNQLRASLSYLFHGCHEWNQGWKVWQSHCDCVVVIRQYKTTFNPM